MQASRNVALAQDGGAAAPPGPRSLELDDAGQVEQQLLGVPAPDDLHRDRQAVDQPDRDGDGRVPGRVGGDGQGTVVPHRGLEPVFGDEVHAVDRRRHRPLGAEGHVGVGCTDDEVDLLEDLRHLHDDLPAEGLDVLGGVEVVVVGRDVGRQHDLGRELGLAAGVEVTQADEQARRAGEGPLQAAPGERDGHVDPRRARRP